MTLRTPLPSHEAVQLAIQQLTESAGKPPAVLALARHLGLANTTLRRNFPDLVTGLAHRPSPQPVDAADVGAGRFERLQRENADLRRLNRDLSEHLDLAIANIQRLTLDNLHLRQQFEAVTQVTRIDSWGRPGPPR